MYNFVMGVVPALFLMAIVVGVHEYGHYFVARRLGLNIRRFALGFGRPVATWTSRKTGVEYSLRAIPLGGFVDIQPHGARSLDSAGALKRALIYAAGPLANVLFALCLFTGLHYTGLTRAMPPVLTAVEPNGPAERVGMKVGDRILAIEGVSIDSYSDLDIFAKVMSPKRPITFTVARAGEKYDFVLQREKGLYGAWFKASEDAKSLGEALQNGFNDVRHAVAMTIRLPSILWNADRSILSQFNGPVSIAQTTGTAVMTANPFASMFALAAAISMAIAIANMLPVPALDGGRIILSLIEFAISRRPSAALERGLALSSLALIASAALIVTINDLARLFGSELI